jgi:hypothetical protein
LASSEQASLLFCKQVIDLLSKLFANQVVGLLSKDLAKKATGLLLASRLLAYLPSSEAEQAGLLFVSRSLTCSASSLTSRSMACLAKSLL